MARLIFIRTDNTTRYGNNFFQSALFFGIRNVKYIAATISRLHRDAQFIAVF